MRCAHAQAKLSAYLDNELASTWRRAVHGHLLGCDACRAMAHDLEALRGQLRVMPEPEVPAHLFARIEQTLDAQDAEHSEAPAFAQTLRAWWAAWRQQRGVRVGLGLVAVAGMAMVLGTWGGPKDGAAPRSAPVAVAPPLFVDASDDEATSAYLEVVSELRRELRQSLRIDDAADVAIWHDVEQRLSALNLALARATDAQARRQLGSEAAAYLSEVLAQHRTNALIARASW